MRVLGLACLLLLLAAGPDVAAGGLREPREPPGGMPPERELEVTLREWLVTGDDLHAAWAGWLIAERRLVELRGAVEERLARTATGQGPRAQEYFVEQALLDALVGTGGSVPTSTLRGLAPAHVEVVTVLLCRCAAFDAAHLAVFGLVSRGLDREAYVALGNVMAQWRVPAFTARILADLELRRRVRIWDQDPPYPPFRGPSDSVPGDGFFRVPEGYPPVADWSLSFVDYEWSQWTKLCDGPRPVYTRRTVSYGGMIGFGGSGCSPEPRQAYRHEWLAAFLDGEDIPDLPVFDTIDIKWSGGRQPWARKTRRAIEGLHAAFRAWRDALHARGLLTDEGRRSARPRIELTIHDERRLTRHALPPFPEVPFDPQVPERRRLPRRGGI